MIKYSLIVPCYNEEKNIISCLESLKMQSFKDREIIVVDNNSKDKTFSYAKKLIPNVISEKKQGYTYAVMKGIETSKGKYIGICDADSRYPKDWLKEINRSFLVKKKPVAVYGGAKTYDGGWFLNSTSRLFFGLFLSISKLLGLDNTCGFNFVFSKEAYTKSGGYDPEYNKASPDIILGKKLKKLGKLKLRPFLYVYTSSRRFNNKGFGKTLIMFSKLWFQALIGKEPSLSYNEYNK